MKKLLFLTPLGLLLYVGLSSSSTGYAGNKTGSSADTAGCGGYGCHAVSATPGVAVSIVLDSAGTIVSHYTPGFAYRLKVTGVNTLSSSFPKFGFQVAAYKGSGTTATQAGAFSHLPASSGVGTWGGIDVVGHINALTATGTGATGSLDTFSMVWTAPVAGSGTVNITSVVNMVTGDGFAGTDDKWNVTTVAYAEGAAPNGIATARKNGFSVYPNPANSNLWIYTDDLGKATSYSIHALNGEQLLWGTINCSVERVNIEDLTYGMYLLTIQTGGVNQTQLIYKQ